MRNDIVRVSDDSKSEIDGSLINAKRKDHPTEYSSKKEGPSGGQEDTLSSEGSMQISGDRFPRNGK